MTYAIEVFPTQSPCITELIFLFYALCTGQHITNKGLLSTDDVGRNILRLPRTGFTAKETNIMKKKKKVTNSNLKRDLRLQEASLVKCRLFFRYCKS